MTATDLPGGATMFDDSIHTHRAASSGAVRIESDSLGPVEVPAEVYWG